ncbi:MAG: cytochrome c [Bryobacteraceae bacterium]|nr:cytochrome c [Bryobacteraceae bacterium]
MKKPFIFALLGVISISLGLALDEKELHTKMKAAGDHMGGLRKGMQAGNMEEVAKHSEGISGALRGTGAFWRERKMDDAVKFTRDGMAAARELTAAAKAGKADEAKAASAKLGGSCKGCHEAHREKLPDGTYKIK